MEDLYKNAVRRKLAFHTRKGTVILSELWELPLKDLDAMAVELHHTLNTTGTVSYLEEADGVAQPKTRAIEDNRMRLEVLVDIIRTRQAENRQIRERRIVEEQRQLLEDILKRKQLASLEDLSTEELERRIASLS